MRKIDFKAVIQEKEGVFVTPILDAINFISKTCEWTTYTSGTEEYEEYEDFYVKLLQYTGCKDKRGVKIYESDIVNYLDSEGRDSIAEVTYEDGGVEIFQHIHQSCLKVVGNMHTHIELANQIRGE